MHISSSAKEVRAELHERHVDWLMEPTVRERFCHVLVLHDVVVYAAQAQHVAAAHLRQSLVFGRVVVESLPVEVPVRSLDEALLVLRLRVLQAHAHVSTDVVHVRGGSVDPVGVFGHFPGPRHLLHVALGEGWDHELGLVLSGLLEQHADAHVGLPVSARIAEQDDLTDQRRRLIREHQRHARVRVDLDLTRRMVVHVQNHQRILVDELAAVGRCEVRLPTRCPNVQHLDVQLRQTGASETLPAPANAHAVLLADRRLQLRLVALGAVRISTRGHHVADDVVEHAGVTRGDLTTYHVAVSVEARVHHDAGVDVLVALDLDGLGQPHHHVLACERRQRGLPWLCPCSRLRTLGRARVGPSAQLALLLRRQAQIPSPGQARLTLRSFVREKRWHAPVLDRLGHGEGKAFGTRVLLHGERRDATLLMAAEAVIRDEWRDVQRPRYAALRGASDASRVVIDASAAEIDQAEHHEPAA